MNFKIWVTFFEGVHMFDCFWASFATKSVAPNDFKTDKYLCLTALVTGSTGKYRIYNYILYI